MGCECPVVRGRVFGVLSGLSGLLSLTAAPGP